jgi:glycosyltransferase involved in cell wall biosynthesis
MRILILSSLYAPYVVGGAEIAARKYAEQLENMGHEIFVLTSSYGLSAPQQEGHIWRTLHFIPGHFWSYRYTANARKLQRVIAEVQPDVLYVWEIMALGLVPMLKVLNAAAIPVVYQQQSYWLLYVLHLQNGYSHVRYRWIKRLLIGAVPFPRYTSMIAVSNAVKEEHVKLGCDAEGIEVIYNGIDDSFITTPSTREDQREPDSVRLVYVGRLVKAKGVQILLAALDILCKEQKQYRFSLDIFGADGEEYTQKLYDQVKARQLETAVTFHGKVRQDELIRQYDRADMVIIPSIWKEPGCAVIIEAMARGVPLIATNIGGTSEMVAHGVDGLLVEPGDERVLATTILNLAEDVSLQAKLTQAGRDTVREQYTVEGTARRIEQHLLRALHGEVSKAPVPPAKI